MIILTIIALGGAKQLAVMAYGFGLTRLVGVRFRGYLELAAVSLVAGNLAVYLVSFCFGLAGLYYSGLAFAALAAGLALGVFFLLTRRVSKAVDTPPPPDGTVVQHQIFFNGLMAIVGAMVLFYLLRNYLFAISSPMVDDESMRWLRVVRMWSLYHGHKVLWEEGVYWNPLVTQTLDMFAYLIHGLNMVKLDRLFYVLTMWAFISLFSRRLTGRDYSPVVMAIFLCTHYSNYLICQTELKGLIMTGTWSLASAWLYFRLLTADETLRYNVLTGAVLGVASSIIPQNALLAVGTGLHLATWHLFGWWKQGRSLADLKPRLISVATYLVPALLVSAIWWGRSYILTGTLLKQVDMIEFRSVIGKPETMLDVAHNLARVFSYGELTYGSIQTVGWMIGLGGVVCLINAFRPSADEFYRFAALQFGLMGVVVYGVISNLTPRYYGHVWVLLSIGLIPILDSVARLVERRGWRPADSVTDVPGGRYSPVAGCGAVVEKTYSKSKHPGFMGWICESAFGGRRWSILSYQIASTILVVTVAFALAKYMMPHYSYTTYETMKVNGVREAMHELPRSVVDRINAIIEAEPDSRWVSPLRSSGDYFMNTANLRTVHWMAPYTFDSKILRTSGPTELFRVLKEDGVDYLIFSDYTPGAATSEMQRDYMISHGRDPSDYTLYLVYFKMDEEGQLLAYDDRFIDMVCFDMHPVFEIFGASFVFRLRTEPKMTSDGAWRAIDRSQTESICR